MIEAEKKSQPGSRKGKKMWGWNPEVKFGRKIIDKPLFDLLIEPTFSLFIIRRFL